MSGLVSLALPLDVFPFLALELQRVGYKNLSRIKSKENVWFSRILSEENGCKKLIIDSLLETKIEGKLIQTKKIAIKACE